MSEAQHSYRQILKATSIFGGVQVFQILIAIIRSKFVAILLGPTGMGIVGLFNSTIDLINQFTKLGLDTSAVKDIAVAHHSGNPERIQIVISTLRRLVWVTGLLGSIIIIVFSPLLSRLVFDSEDYTIAFIWLSSVLLFKQLTTGQMAILQGTRKLKYLAKANLYASFLGLLVTIPLYYFFRLDAIVPVIIISSLMALCFSWYFSNRLELKSVKISNTVAFSEGREMLRLGLMLSLRGLITMVAAYSIQLFVSHYGGVEQVGFYAAGFVIINSYVGMVFGAMQTDYFPKLSGIADDSVKLRAAVLEQAVIAILLITPIIVVFLTLAPTAIVLLYSEKFLPITMLVSWGMFGTLFKAVSWSMGYVILAKGDSKLFIKTAILFNAIFVTMLILGYYFYGLLGVGIAFFIYYIIHLVLVRLITYYKYDVYFNKNFNGLFLICLVLCSTTFAMSYIETPVIKFSLMGLMVIISSIFTLYQLNKKVDIKAILKKSNSKKDD